MKIRRFPRLAEDYPEAAKASNALTRRESKNLMRSSKLPRGYDRLTRRQKKLARRIVNGLTVKEACRAMGMDTNTFYRYMNFHPLFKQYYLRYAQKVSSEIGGRLDAKMGRAVQVVENALDHPDYYLATDQAVKLLSGRGWYKKNVDSKQHVVSNLHVDGKIKIGKSLDKDLIDAFVSAIGKMAMGQKEVRPKIVDGKVTEKILNLLPEPAPNANNTQIQKVDEAKTA